MARADDLRVEHERLLALLEAARTSLEQERRRWARELHDTTLQGLAAALLNLSATQRSDDEARVRTAVVEVIACLGDEITTLRALIADIAPAALLDGGIGDGLRALAERARSVHGVAIELQAELEHERGLAPTRLAPEVETAIYRTVQDALEQITRQEGSVRARIAVQEAGGVVRAAVSADGGDPVARLELPALHRAAPVAVRES